MNWLLTNACYYISQTFPKLTSSVRFPVLSQFAPLSALVSQFAPLSALVSQFAPLSALERNVKKTKRGRGKHGCFHPPSVVENELIF